LNGNGVIIEKGAEIKENWQSWQLYSQQ
jgi:hypothetical protein